MAVHALAIPTTMAAVMLTGHGGTEKLVWREEAPTPTPAPGEVLVEIRAAGVNNTDINTRIGWYSSGVGGGTEEAVSASSDAPADGDWTGGGLAFPRIQGADACGLVVAVGPGVSPGRIGERVIVQSCLVSLGDGEITPWLGSERDGAFAQFVTAPSDDTYAVDGSLTDVELAAIPCGYGTAQNLLSRAGVRVGDRVLVTGASGNVGLAAVQLAAQRGAEVFAIAAGPKHDALRAIGARQCLERGGPIARTLGPRSIDAVIDVVGGPQWPDLLDVLRTGGRYAVSGAIAGPLVSLDLRKLYLKDLTLIGCTKQDRPAFVELVGLARLGAIRPPVARTFPLSAIAEAQALFQTKTVIGKIVLVPPAAFG
ncbi:MAG: alcohol dehydrogenase family protein [Phyllobacteriaceae bacterium]|nr:alcohol dehydrogenase family protein [Phyllobacteriaceae bacterium]